MSVGAATLAAMLLLVLLVCGVIIASLAMICLRTLTLDWARDRDPIVRAEALLRAHLSEAELKQLVQYGILQVPSPHYRGRVYCVRAAGGRVSVRRNGALEMELCIVPREPLPGREHVLAHKLMIQAAEEDYMRRANVLWRAADPSFPAGLRRPD